MTTREELEALGFTNVLKICESDITPVSAILLQLKVALEYDPWFRLGDNRAEILLFKTEETMADIRGLVGLVNKYAGQRGYKDCRAEYGEMLIVGRPYIFVTVYQS